MKPNDPNLQLAKNSAGKFKTNPQLVAELAAANRRIRNLEARVIATSKPGTPMLTRKAKVTKHTVAPRSKPSTPTRKISVDSLLRTTPEETQKMVHAVCARSKAGEAIQEQVKEALATIPHGETRIKFFSKFKTILNMPEL